MTLPSTGSISISQINTELGRTSNAANTSLTSLSTGAYVAINYASVPYPNPTAPHGMSEWRGYNHQATPTVTLTGTSFSVSTNNFTFNWTYAGLPSSGYFTLDWYDDAWNTSTSSQTYITSPYVMGSGVHYYDIVNHWDNSATYATMYYTINMRNSGGTSVASASSQISFYYANI